MLYFADIVNTAHASIMITGSHNPKNDNGFKMLHQNNVIFGDKITELQALVRDQIVNKIYEPIKLPLETQDLSLQYIQTLTRDIQINPELKVVWDPGNGATGMVISKLLEKLPNQNILINGDMDGNFPNHHPDPTIPANLEQLKKKVLETNSDLGVAFDGDGDRIGVISNTGEFIYADTLMCIYAEEILAQNPRASLVCDIKTSSVFTDLVTDLGGTAYVAKTGNVFVKEKLLETNAVFGGELSGHIFFKDRYHGYDDGIYAALRLIEILSKNSRTLQDIVGLLPKVFNTPEIRIPTANKCEIITSVRQILQDKKQHFSDLDGIRVDKKDEGWWLLRASNTEDYIVLRIEALSQSNLHAIQKKVKEILSSVAPDLANHLKF
jgi:phosphomannomutase